jgi:hypothetical protein
MNIKNGEVNMKKKVIIISTIIAAIIVLGSCSYSITASNLEFTESEETVDIEVNKYNLKSPISYKTRVNIKEAEEIKEILINLNEAITNNDDKAIAYYEKQLNSKGIFGEDYQEFLSNEKLMQENKLSKNSKLMKLLGDKNGDDVSNLFCVFNAIGEGIFVSYIGVLALEAVVRIINNASSGIEALILLLIFLPLALTVVLLTSLVPFRILMPRGLVQMENGRMSTLGLRGVKRVTIEEEITTVNLSLFTGLSISIPANNESGRDAFVFASGFAFAVEGYQS